MAREMMDILDVLKLWNKSNRTCTPEWSALDYAIKEIKRLRDVERLAILTVAWELSGHDKEHINLDALRKRLPKDRTNEMIEEIAKPGFSID